MSYSRWSKDSVWYTFWTSSLSPSCTYKFPTTKLKNEQHFEICDYPSYYISYGDLKTKGIKQIIKEVQEFYSGKKETSLSDYTKLRWYLIEFMTDIEDHFVWYNFFRYEWYYPIRNEIRWFFRERKKRLLKLFTK